MAVVPTRRGFIGGTIVGAAIPGVARAQSPTGAPQAKQRIVRRGRAIAAGPKGERLVVAHDRRHTVAVLTPRSGRVQLVDVGGQPLEVAVSPNGRVAAVTTASWDGPGLTIVDVATGAVRSHVDVGRAPFGVAFTPRGDRLIVGGGEQEGTIHVLETRHFGVIADAAVGLVPRAIAPRRDGKSAWVVLNAEDRVVRVDLASGKITRTVRTPWLPDRVAPSPDGRRLLVSHGGPDAKYVSEIELGSGRVHRRAAGRLPSAVAWTPRGRRLVALAGAGEVVVLGRGGRDVRRRVGGSPRGLAVAGERVWTVDGLTGDVRRVRT